MGNTRNPPGRMGVTRFWRYSKEKMVELIQQGRVVQTKPGAVPVYKCYLDEMQGVPLQDWWGDIGPIGAQAAEGKKGADKGIDGKIVFQGDPPSPAVTAGQAVPKFETVIISVKAGNTGVAHVRDLRGVVERDKAAVGVLISMQDHTGPMHEEAITAGFFESKTWGRRYPKIQLLTVADLLAGKQIDMPPVKQVDATFKKAPRVAASAGGTQAELTVNGGQQV